MAEYTKQTPGAPTSGRYAVNDSVRDSVGVTWICVEAGLPGKFIGSAFATGGGNPTLAASTVTMRDEGIGGYHTTTLTLADFQIPVTDANAFGGSKLITFPQGRIHVTGVIGIAQFGVIGDRATTINNNSTLDWALGTVTASNVVLAGTMIDLAPLVDEQAIGDNTAYGASGNSVLAAAAVFDGTTTAKDMFLNVAFSDNTDIDGNGVLKVQGTIVITWQFLGDK